MANRKDGRILILSLSVLGLSALSAMNTRSIRQIEREANDFKAQFQYEIRERCIVSYQLDNWIMNVDTSVSREQADAIVADKNNRIRHLECFLEHRLDGSWSKRGE